MEFQQKLNEILVKIGILQETLFFHDRASNLKMLRFKQEHNMQVPTLSCGMLDRGYMCKSKKYGLLYG